MATKKNADNRYNSDNNGIQYQQKSEFSGATSDELILPSHGSHTFNFTTSGTGKIQITMSSVEDIESGAITDYSNAAIIDLGISRIPILSKDSTDRNRTSPFAFTGNKFEFRAVGSAQSISFPATVLNAIVAESLNDIANIKHGQAVKE